MSILRSTEEHLLYITECTLATVGYMAGLKRRKVGEFNRQVNIAQDAMMHIGQNWEKFSECKGNYPRVKEVVKMPEYSVMDWAKRWMA